jgi:hypothetical protein
MASRLSPQLFTLVLACLACADAAELGDAKVSSYTGQQLVADIELTSVEDASRPVQVRLASPDVYQGANLVMPPVLSSLNMNVMRRDGKQYLHVTSLKPVGADHLHLYVELVDGGRKAVRLATLWFTPDPTPPAPARAATPAPISVAAPAPTPAPALTAAPASAPASAPKPKMAQPAPKPAPAPAPESTPKPVSAPATVSASSEPAPPLARTRPAHPQTIPMTKAQSLPACRNEESTAESACTALDSKNADLRAQIVKLEARVQSLQAAAFASLGPLAHIAARPASAAAGSAKPQPAATGQPAGRLEGQPWQLPAPKAAQQPIRQGAVAAQPAPGLPWGWIAGAGAAVFALIGGWQFWRRKRQTGKRKQANVARPETEEPVEPTLG